MRSELGRGTTVVLALPLVRPPKWFVSVLELDPRDAIVVLDDDTSIHQVWQGRFDSLRSEGLLFEIWHFSTPEDLRDWVGRDASRATRAVYLMDYELLDQKDNGLSLIEELRLGERAILVTSRFEEKVILDECLRVGARMIPEGLAGFVPIHVRGASEARDAALDAVLIDDDELTRTIWNSAAKRAGKKFHAYADAATFFVDLETGAIDLPKSAALYVDSNLGGGIKGEDVAEELYGRGYTNIRIATGHEPSRFEPAAHICEIVGKDPPWA
ncbi:MAG: hypothetical protein KGL74_04090 [Elusimicrobia bacterium]|nr:hypothetical protein [Elusimicrobiota bacterium]